MSMVLEVHQMGLYLILRLSMSVSIWLSSCLAFPGYFCFILVGWCIVLDRGRRLYLLAITTLVFVGIKLMKSEHYVYRHSRNQGNMVRSTT